MMKCAVIAFGCALWVFASGSGAKAELLLTPDEIEQVLSHGPWPPEYALDPSNRVSGNPAAIELGEALFSDPVLSSDGAMSCKTCHAPEMEFTDGQPRAMGRNLLDRNTQALTNLHVHRWFGWSGSTDNLWAQSLLPILNPEELASDPAGLKDRLGASDVLADFEALFGVLETQEPIEVAVNVSKALAAYQETLVTNQTPFDVFRDALDAGDLALASEYPEAAQRGLQIFIGEGQCSFCHSGPAFTNGEFHDAGMPYFVTETRVDTGRFGGLQALLESPFTLDGGFSDDPEKSGAWAVRGVTPLHSDFGTFRVPGLRNVARTAPYMHDGSLADLDAVVAHYNTIDLERMHADGEAILQPLGLSDAALSDIVAFLETLSD